VNQQIHPGSHLDADQLSTFVEGVASEREREQMLAHLAGCDACREMVFLLQGSDGAPAAATAVPARRGWRNWFTPLGLAGAALACGVTALVYFRVHNTIPERVQQSAAVQPPNSASVAPPPSETHSETQAMSSVSGKEPIEPRQSPKPIAAPAQTVGAAAGEMRQMKPTAPSPDASTAKPAAAPAVAEPAAVERRQPAEVNQVAVAPAPASATRANEAVIEQPSIGDRSLSELSYRAPLPALRIEHNRGLDDGLSELSGRVTDASGALVSGATVSLRDAVGSTREATTAADGTFNLAGIAAGKYDLLVTARGFESNRQSINLQPRDVAKLDSVLKVGASTETVTVTASTMALETDAAQISSVLPSHMPAASSVANGKRVLSMDTVGALFLSRNGGKSWRKVKPVWTGKVTEIALATPAEPSESRSIDLKRKIKTSGSSKAFQLTTDSGAVWVSPDGAHWQAQ
jgi:hypothetical protein